MKPFMIAEIPYGPNGFTTLIPELGADYKSIGEEALSRLPSTGVGSTNDTIKDAIFVSRLKRQSDSGREGRECLAIIGVNVNRMKKDVVERIEWKLGQLLETLEEEVSSIENISRRLNVIEFPLLLRWQEDLKVAKLPCKFRGIGFSSIKKLITFLFLLLLAVSVWLVGRPMLIKLLDKAVEPKKIDVTPEVEESLNHKDVDGQKEFHGDLPTSKEFTPHPAAKFCDDLKDRNVDLPLFLEKLGFECKEATQKPNDSEAKRIKKMILEVADLWANKRINQDLETFEGEALFLKDLKDCFSLTSTKNAICGKFGLSESELYNPVVDEVFRRSLDLMITQWEDGVGKLEESTRRFIFPNLKAVSEMRTTIARLPEIVGDDVQSSITLCESVLNIFEKLTSTELEIDCSLTRGTLIFYYLGNENKIEEVILRPGWQKVNFLCIANSRSFHKSKATENPIPPDLRMLTKRPDLTISFQQDRHDIKLALRGGSEKVISQLGELSDSISKCKSKLREVP